MRVRAYTFVFYLHHYMKYTLSFSALCAQLHFHWQPHYVTVPLHAIRVHFPANLQLFDLAYLPLKPRDYLYVRHWTWYDVWAARNARNNQESKYQILKKSGRDNTVGQGVRQLLSILLPNYFKSMLSHAHRSTQRIRPYLHALQALHACVRHMRNTHTYAKTHTHTRLLIAYVVLVSGKIALPRVTLLVGLDNSYKISCHVG